MTYLDGAPTEAAFDFVSAGGQPTWADHIAPLYQARCAACHGGDTATVLDSAAAWAARIQDIIKEVSSGRMPLGGEILSTSEIVMIESWRDGGFP